MPENAIFIKIAVATIVHSIPVSGECTSTNFNMGSREDGQSATSVFVVVPESKFLGDPVHARVGNIVDKQTVFDGRVAAFQDIDGGSCAWTTIVEEDTVLNHDMAPLQATMFDGNSASAQTSGIVNNPVVLDCRDRTSKNFDRPTISIKAQTRLQAWITTCRLKRRRGFCLRDEAVCPGNYEASDCCPARDTIPKINNMVHDCRM